MKQNSPWDLSGIWWWYSFGKGAFLSIGATNLRVIDIMLIALGVKGWLALFLIAAIGSRSSTMNIHLASIIVSAQHQLTSFQATQLHDSYISQRPWFPPRSSPFDSLARSVGSFENFPASFTVMGRVITQSTKTKWASGGLSVGKLSSPLR